MLYPIVITYKFLQILWEIKRVHLSDLMPLSANPRSELPREHLPLAGRGDGVRPDGHAVCRRQDVLGCDQRASAVDLQLSIMLFR